MKVKLRCYCCGKPLGDTFSLVTLSENRVDRVFVMLPEHVAKVEDGRSILVTSKARRPRRRRGR